MITWILDNGHGVDTPGKRAGELEEWLFNRNIPKYVTYELISSGIPHHNLVPEEYDVSLRARSARANEFAEERGRCVLVSIHGNAYEGKRPHKVSGIETFYYSKAGKKLAKIFQSELVSGLGWRDRGVKKANFYILKRTSMPAVLLELGFYTNEYERELMLSAEYQYKMGVAIAKAIQTINNQTT